ncbi:hypothetical protein ACIPVB_02890 [Microbacterium sp. NPDC090007]|uniref:hypothetical protein n=1 Tax=Microbacterium sp. NPDC090007 TaxID=3364204 RepID=UPI003830B874
MPEWLIVVLGLVAGLVVLWLALVVVRWVPQRRSGGSVDRRAVLRLAPTSCGSSVAWSPTLR